MKPSRPLLLFTLLLLTHVVRADVGTYLILDAFIFSEPIAIKSLNNDWQGSFKGGEVAFTTDRAEVGFMLNQFRIGAVKRYDYFYRFAKDTAELVYVNKNKDRTDASMTPGRDYELMLTINSLNAQGWNIGYKIQPHSTLTIDAAFSFLQGTELMDGGLWGNAQALSETDYDFTFDIDYVYTEDAMFDRKNPRPSGEGYSFDLALSWQPTPQWKLDWIARDLFSEITWQQAPFTTAIGSSNTKEFDEDGYVKFKPVISGTEYFRYHAQKIPRKIFFNSEYVSESQITLLAEYSDYDLQRFFFAGLGYRFANNRIELLFSPRWEAYTLKAEGVLPWKEGILGPARMSPKQMEYSFRLTSDASNFDDSRLVALNLALRLVY